MVRILDTITRVFSWSTAFQISTRPRQHDLSTFSLHEKIPGGSPLAYCNESRPTDLYQIDHIELYPNPLHMYVTIFAHCLLLTQTIARSDDIFQVHLYGMFDPVPSPIEPKMLIATPGTFLKNVTDNATLAYTARYGNSTESESGTMDWCKGFIDSIDQPDPHRQHDCPPEKGFGLIMMSSWVWPMFIVPVSFTLGGQVGFKTG